MPAPQRKRATVKRIQPKRKSAASDSSQLRLAFSNQAKACTALGSPFNQLVCDLFASRVLPRGPVTGMLNDWPGNPGNTAHDVPPRMTGALHALVLEGKSAALAALYPTNNPDSPYQLPSADTLWSAISEALTEHKLFFMSHLQQAPQTNEVRRSAIVLAGMLHALHETQMRSVVLSELGSSAGLNLLPDQYAITLSGIQHGPGNSAVQLKPKWSGEPVAECEYDILDRAGCDLHALDSNKREHQTRLLSSISPDQHERMADMRAAMRITAEAGVHPANQDAANWLDKRLKNKFQGRLHLVFNTVAWQGFDDETQRRCRSALHAAAKRADKSTPLAWLQIEPDAEQAAGLSIQLTVWPGGGTQTLGRAHCHGDWIHWDK